MVQIFSSVCIQAETADNAGTTALEIYTTVNLLRQEPSFQWGLFRSEVIHSVYFYIRQAKGFDGFLVALNFGPNVTNVNFLQGAASRGLVAEKGVVEVHTIGSRGISELEVGTEVQLNNLQLKPSEGVIFRWPPEAVGQQM